MAGIKTVLFVCTGNSCRSVMAEGLLKKYLEDLGKDIAVMSAGTGTLDGMPPTIPTIEVMKAEGIDVSAFRSKILTEKLIKAADLILVMEAMHKEEVLRRVPSASSKTYLLREFGRSGKAERPKDPEIPDPIGQPVEYYRNSLYLIKDELQRITRII